MIDELKLLGELAQQVSIAQASLRQKEALLKKLLDEIPLESRGIQCAACAAWAAKAKTSSTGADNAADLL